jgi:glycosyltransferase involved in cell wall biosynthesis
MLAVYQARPDIRLTWPDALGVHRESFARWFVETSELQGIVPACYVDPIRDALAHRPDSNRTQRPVRLRPRGWDRQLIAGALTKAAVAFREGRLPFSPRKWWQLYTLHTIEQAQQSLARQTEPLPAVALSKVASDRSLGVSVVGYFSDATGVGAGGQATIEACRAVGLDAELIDARPKQPRRGQHQISLLHVNADQTTVVANALGADFFRDRYTIGIWVWELPHFPDAYCGAFHWVNEVWAVSRFVQQAVGEKAAVPVIHMPHAIGHVNPRPLARRDLDLSDDDFLFLMMYDTLSVQERKNPLGVIEAFQRAFPSRRDVRLIIKINHAASRPEEVASIRERVAAAPGILLVDRPMTRAEAQSLQSTCDAFVSLHRSEGFGLNIAEAMALGKPVVVTGWSGNMDFTTDRNACLVDFRLEELTEDHGPYRRGSHWAEPSLDGAAEAMLKLVEDSSYRQTIALRGRATIAEEFSPQAIGQRYRRRLEAISRLRRQALR